MTKEEYSRSAHDLIYLVRCALCGTIPERERVEKMVLDTLFLVAEKHMLKAIAASSLEAAGASNGEFTKARLYALNRSIRFDHYRSLVFAGLEERGIAYLPLKGAVIREYYPDPALREMVDVDVLIDPERRADVRTLMEELGFTTRLYGNRVDDNYIVQPGIVFEMHSSLFGEFEDNRIAEYYADVFSRLEKSAENGYELRFSDGDLLVYLIAHEYKHFKAGGVGIRALADLFVCMRAAGDAVDTEYVYGELDRMGIGDHARRIIPLALKVFSGDENGLDGDERELLDFIIFSGVFGTVDNFVAERTRAAGSGLGAAKELVFLTETDLRNNYPFFAKHRALRPLLFFYRSGRGLTVSRKKAAAVLGSLFKKKK